MTNPVAGAAQTAGTAYTRHATSSQPPVKAPGELGKDEFLQLLVAQMRYQDPSAPMDSSQLMAQTSQLASVERLTELSTLTRQSFDLQTTLAATAMVGRRIDYVQPDGATSSGVVDRVALDGPAPVLRVGDQDVALNQISAIGT